MQHVYSDEEYAALLRGLLGVVGTASDPAHIMNIEQLEALMVEYGLNLPIVRRVHEPTSE